jgi:hypothetical protein
MCFRRGWGTKKNKPLVRSSRRDRLQLTAADRPSHTLNSPPSWATRTRRRSSASCTTKGRAASGTRRRRRSITGRSLRQSVRSLTSTQTSGGRRPVDLRHDLGRSNGPAPKAISFVPADLEGQVPLNTTRLPGDAASRAPTPAPRSPLPRSVAKKRPADLPDFHSADSRHARNSTPHAH